MLTNRKVVLLAIPLGVFLIRSAMTGNFDLSWYTINGGGGVSSGGGFELAGTIGQPDASPAAAIGGDFECVGGFWAAASTAIILGDCDGDGDVDLDDHADFYGCLSGPGGGIDSGCDCFDTDGSGDVDLFDAAVLQVMYTGL